MSITKEETGRLQRNGHTLELRATYWRCLQCDHRFEVAQDADLFWCGDDCTGKHPGDTTTPRPGSAETEETL